MAIITRWQYRADTAANWTASNPTLAAGEVGVEKDTQGVKVGDGTTAWAALPYLFPAGGLVAAIGALITASSAPIRRDGPLTYASGAWSAVLAMPPAAKSFVAYGIDQFAQTPIAWKFYTCDVTGGKQGPILQTVDTAGQNHYHSPFWCNVPDFCADGVTPCDHYQIKNDGAHDGEFWVDWYA